MISFGLPPWLKRAKDVALEVSRALVKYTPPPAAELTDADELNGWTPEGLSAYRAESDARAMAIVATRMQTILHRQVRPRWANNRYSPLHWRG